MSERKNEVSVGDLTGRWFDLAIDDDEVTIDQIEVAYVRRLAILMGKAKSSTQEVRGVGGA